ncbi:hypothetical protein ACSQ67_025641 [Phaseolus vulgaris]
MSSMIICDSSVVKHMCMFLRMRDPSWTRRQGRDEFGYKFFDLVEKKAREENTTRGEEILLTPGNIEKLRIHLTHKRNIASYAAISPATAPPALSSSTCCLPVSSARTAAALHRHRATTPSAAHPERSDGDRA